MEITDNESGMRKNVRALVVPLPPYFVAKARRLAGFCSYRSFTLQTIGSCRGSSFEVVCLLDHLCRLRSCDRAACRLDDRRQLQCQFGHTLICSQAYGLRLRISTDLRRVYTSPVFRGPCATSNSFSGTMLLPLGPNIASVRPLPLNPAVLFLVGTIISQPFTERRCRPRFCHL